MLLFLDADLGLILFEALDPLPVFDPLLAFALLPDLGPLPVLEPLPDCFLPFYTAPFLFKFISSPTFWSIRPAELFLFKLFATLLKPCLARSDVRLGGGFALVPFDPRLVIDDDNFLPPNRDLRPF